MYTVVGCTECESVKIMREGVNRATCNRCQAQIVIEDAQVIYSTNDLEEAKEARSISMAQRNGFDYLVEEMVDKEVVKENVSTRVADHRLLEKVKEKKENGDDEQINVEPSESEQESIGGPADSVEEQSSGEDPKKRIVLDAIEFLDEPRDGDVVEFAVERGVSEEHAERIVDELCMNAEAMRTRDGVIKKIDK